MDQEFRQALLQRQAPTRGDAWEDKRMIPHLKYPEDAGKVIDSLHAGLRYDAAIAVLGRSCSKAPLEPDTPDFSAGIRYGRLEDDKAVRREAEGLLPRFSFISLVSRFETHVRALLLQRRVLEELRGPGVKMMPQRLWGILRRVNEEVRSGPVIVCSRLLVEHPSSDLRGKMKWLEGIYRVRNCLAHRLGKVEIIDVKPPGAPLDTVKDTDTLRAVWLRLRATSDGQEMVNFPHQITGPGNVDVKFEEYEREWKIRDQIDITAQECQFVAISLSLLGNQVFVDFVQEMNAVLGISADGSLTSPRAAVKKGVPRAAGAVDVVPSEEPTSSTDTASGTRLKIHFAALEFKKGANGVVLPAGHGWACNASLPSWSKILSIGLLQHLPSVYLCEHHAVELGFHWSGPSTDKAPLGFLSGGGGSGAGLWQIEHGFGGMGKRFEEADSRREVSEGFFDCASRPEIAIPGRYASEHYAQNDSWALPRRGWQ